MKQTIYCRVKDGKCSNGKAIRDAFSRHEGKDVAVTIERKRSKRSDRQNRLWWLYMTILSKDLGYTKDEMHEICKMKFLKLERVDEKTGLVLPYLGSTAALNKSDFGELVDSLLQWSSETFNIVLPLPDEQMEMF